MNVYGYARLSRDEDNRTKESLEVQQNLIRSYAKENNLNLIKIFVDDNVSGYTFDRDDLNELKELIKKNKVDVLLAKDLSRIGRHNAKTLFFLEFLKEYNVRLILINEDYDSKEDDDDIIGIKTWYNERYVKDISRKIKAHIKHKQKEEGLVIIPPFGYIKNEKGDILIDEDVAFIVKEIFRLYISGHGVKNVAKELNKKGYITPVLRKRELYKGFANKKYKTAHLWNYTTVNRILKNEAYIGTLICGKTKREKIKGKKIPTSPEEQFIHKNFFPSIIKKDDFELVQKLMKSRIVNNVRAKNQKIYKYAGLIQCVDCGNGFVSKSYKTVNGSRVRYVCGTYHKFGKNYCTSHRIFEDILDDAVYRKIKEYRNYAEKLLAKLDEEIKHRRKTLNSYNAAIEKIKIDIYNKKEEIKNYSKQLAKRLINEEIFEELTKEAKNQLTIYEEQLKKMNNLMKEDPNLKEEVIKSIQILDEIIKKRKLDNTMLSILIEKIYTKKTEDDVKFNIKLRLPKLNIDNEGTLS